MRINRRFLAGAVVAVVVLAPATAWATHVFVDVDDDRFYADAVEWAADNGITTGSPAGADTFKPEDPVTRGEVVTFLKRYHDGFVDPLVNSAAAFAGGDSVTSVAQEPSATVVQSVSLMPPADGMVIITSQASGTNTTTGGNFLRCSINEGTDLDFNHLQGTTIVDGGVNSAHLAGVRGFEVAEGELLTVNLVCNSTVAPINVYDAALSAVFAPA